MAASESTDSVSAINAVEEKKVVTSPSASTVPENKLGYSLKVKANYDFTARNSAELSLRKGDIISVLDKDESGWWLGMREIDGKEIYGMFPGNYVATHEVRSLKQLKLATKGFTIT